MSGVRPTGGPKKRGHQHHPRNEGTRRRAILEPVVQCPLSPYSVDKAMSSQLTQRKTNENQNKGLSGQPTTNENVSLGQKSSENISRTNEILFSSKSANENLKKIQNPIKDKISSKQTIENTLSCQKISEKALISNENVLSINPNVQNVDKFSNEPIKNPDDDFKKSETSESNLLVNNTIPKGKSTNVCDNRIDIIDLTQCDDEMTVSSTSSLESSPVKLVSKSASKSTKNERNNKLRKNKKNTSEISPKKSLDREFDMAMIDRPEAEGLSLSDIENDDSIDPELEELSKLRCTSERTEVIAEKEMRRKNRRCADYPGLAFSGLFSSDTLMKFSIIKNEIQNIMNTQLKRAESEVAALNRRIQLLEEDLERSEERLATATAKLAEASAAADESERIRKALENRTNMEDDRVAALEQQLAQAKQIAEEADKKYEEVARKLVMMEQDLERAEERAENSDSKIVELEEELRVVGNNLKSLEVSEEKANQREEEYKNQIKNLTTRLKEATLKEEEHSVSLKHTLQQLQEAAVTREHDEDQIRLISDKLREAEARAEFAERSVQKLQKEVDRLEDDLLGEKEKCKRLESEMELTLHEMQNM